MHIETKVDKREIEGIKSAKKDKEKETYKKWLLIFITSINKFNNSSPPSSIHNTFFIYVQIHKS